MIEGGNMSYPEYALAKRCMELESRLAEAEALLAEIEWTKFNSGGQLSQFCPYCNSVKRDSAWHKAGCRLAAFLKKDGEA